MQPHSFNAWFSFSPSSPCPVVIKGKPTILGMGGVGKTRAAIEYAWNHTDDYRALLFISGDTNNACLRKTILTSLAHANCAIKF